MFDFCRANGTVQIDKAVHPFYVVRIRHPAFAVGQTFPAEIAVFFVRITGFAVAVIRMARHMPFVGIGCVMVHQLMFAVVVSCAIIAAAASMIMVVSVVMIMSVVMVVSVVMVMSMVMVVSVIVVMPVVVVVVMVVSVVMVVIMIVVMVVIMIVVVQCFVFQIFSHNGVHLSLRLSSGSGYENLFHNCSLLFPALISPRG